MDTLDSQAGIARQHLIDPEICIRCNTCEATCPINAITHDSRNYIVKFDVCNSCGACISPCPTGAIDSWRQVLRVQAYSIEEQLQWDTLPGQEQLHMPPDEAELPPEIQTLSAAANAGQGGAAVAPRSAQTPYVNVYKIQQPAVAIVTGNFRLTGDDATSDIRHIVLDLGAAAFPVLEGQTIGVVTPGVDLHGRPHHVRLYSVASPRDGERPQYNNLSITAKRVTEDHDGNPVRGVASNYLCDLRTGDKVQLVGPYGTTFLMPNHAGSNLLMICTGTGSAPMRAMTERRRRMRGSGESGDLMLFFGARAADELPYFGPLMKLPKEFIDINLAFSRAPEQPKQYVQALIRERHVDVAKFLSSDEAHIYICGLKGMEHGVDAAFREVCSQHGMNWDALLPQLRETGRYHVETY